MTIKILSGLYLGNVRCKKLTFRRDIGWGCQCAVPCCDLGLICDLVALTLTFNILSGLIFLETVSCRKFVF